MVRLGIRVCIFPGGARNKNPDFFNPKTDFTFFNGIEKKKKKKDHESNAMHTL